MDKEAIQSEIDYAENRGDQEGANELKEILKDWEEMENDEKQENN